MHQSWSGVEAEEVEWRQKKQSGGGGGGVEVEEAEWRQRQSEVARGGWRGGREVIP